MRINSPYGSWKSPISAAMLTRHVLSLSSPTMDGQDVYWLEGRPNESGRYVVVRRSGDGSLTDQTPLGFNVRSTVHEYGGGAYAVENGVCYFVNFTDQQIYMQHAQNAPTPLTQTPGMRYADLEAERARSRLICICEDHTGAGEARNTLVAVGIGESGTVRELARGHDFYSSPRISPDGKKLAFLAWDHPNMPWDGCILYLAQIQSDGSLGELRAIAGSKTESICQPQWSPSGDLFYVAETTGWWNIYRWSANGPIAMLPMKAEFGRAQWQFGISTFGFVSNKQILACYTEDGSDKLIWLNTETLEREPYDFGAGDISYVRCSNGKAVIIGGSSTEPVAVYLVDAVGRQATQLRRAFQPSIDQQYFSAGQPMSFMNGAGLQSHAVFYSPRNPDCIAPADSKPPLVVFSHGGPTSSTGTALSLGVQYWTSRGFAVLDVDYGGSTGYGQEYRQRLNGNWGVVDVDDCCSGALHLAEQGFVEREQLAIRGGSAGGFTTLACLTFRNEVFKAGASYYGLSELVRFVTDTHKFESRYLTTLIGPYPERRDLFMQRSPINATDRLNCPIILLQGDEDKVVPQSQSDLMYQAALRKGLPVAYLLFKGEQHGFRRAENIQRAAEAEYYFYSRIFGFTPADAIEPVQIENLPNG